MPPRQEGVAVLWFWCVKNRNWSVRKCTHSRCLRANYTVRQVQRPIEEPR